MNRHERQFIVAYDYLNPQNSTVLNGHITGSPAETLAETIAAQVIGRGVWVCLCRVVEVYDHTNDECFEIVVGGKPTIFEIVSVEGQFPPIEGQVAAGIYKFHQSGCSHYEVRNAFALSQIFDEILDFEYGQEKIVCRSAGISLCEIETGREICFYERHPLSFFDVYCPLCRQKVMTFETDPERLDCRVIDLPCPHFIGNSVWCVDSYTADDLDELNVNYQFAEGELYFETAAGWEKPIIYAPPHQPLDSVWDGSGLNDGFADHLFFAESKPIFKLTESEIK